MRKSLIAVSAAAAVALLWRAAGNSPNSPRANRALSIERDSPETAADRPELESAPPAPARELPAPEPVLQQSAQRRFSSPAAHGASGGIAGTAPASPAPEPGAERGSGDGVILPGGYGAPTSSYASRYSEGAPAGNNDARAEERPGGARRSASAGRKGTASKNTGGDEQDPPEADAPVDGKTTAAAADLVVAARELKARGDATEMRAASGAAAGIMRQLALDNKVDAGIRGAIDRLSRSGRPVTMDAVAEAAEGVLSENGLTSEDADLPAAIARAAGPPPPDLPPAAYAAAVQAIVSTPPLDPAVRAEIQRMADHPPPPRAPAPRGALDAFRKHEGVFDKALDDFGVKPEHILGILGVETTWGRNTGKFPLPATLLAISEKTGRDGRPTKAALQAGRDLAALARLSASGNLGGLTPGQVRGSYAGAMGIPQFLPTSWEAYSRAPDSGKRDPFDFGTAAYSVGNYLKAHGYGKNVPRSIWGYNHSQEYVDKVLGLSADVKAGLNPAAPAQNAPGPINR